MLFAAGFGTLREPGYVPDRLLRVVQRMIHGNTRSRR
jgi:hypothetical protein